jgi:hypothetical protein
MMSVSLDVADVGSVRRISPTARILVVGIDGALGSQMVGPSAYFSLFDVKEYAVYSRLINARSFGVKQSRNSRRRSNSYCEIPMCLETGECQ